MIRPAANSVQGAWPLVSVCIRATFLLGGSGLIGASVVIGLTAEVVVATGWLLAGTDEVDRFVS